VYPPWEKLLPPAKLEVKWGIYLGYQGKEGVAGMIQELSRGEEGIKSAERELGKMNRDAEQWARALFREKAAMDYRSGMGNAREDGVKLGRAQGREEGIVIGEARGLELGLKQARREKLESARRMKKDGFTPEQIQKYSGLSPEEIRKL
jgi:predicted transposase/invertase (TIGR01784 family)